MRTPDDSTHNRGYRRLVVPIIIGIALAFTRAHRVEPAAFSVKSLKGSYGCLGALRETASGNSAELVEVIQLNLDGAGGATGSMRALDDGEDCGGSIVSGSNYTVNPDGTGLLSLTVTFSGADLDKDLADCSTFNTIVSSPEKLDIVLQENGEHFVFAGMDDLVGRPTDGGDDRNGAFRGSCTSQTKS